MTRIETITQLMGEIRALQNTILDNENQILQRRISIMEIMAEQSSLIPSAQFQRAAETPLFPKLSVPFMIKSILPELNGSVFWFPEIKEKAIQKYPQFSTKIKRGLYCACEHLKERGDLVKVPGGFSVKVTS